MTELRVLLVHFLTTYGILKHPSADTSPHGLSPMIPATGSQAEEQSRIAIGSTLAMAW